MVGIVIVNYNGEQFQNECIASLLESVYKDFKIIIVDNGSTDNSMQKLSDFKTDKIVTIYNKENLGVASGNNIGIKESISLGCEYTLLLNNDTVVEPDFLLKLIETKKDIVSPKINFYIDKNKIWFYGGKFKKFKGTVKHFSYGKEKEKKISKCKYAPTCCLLIKNSIFDKIGLFDERYFLYYDDVDFCYRLMKNKINIWLCNNSVIYHKVSMSSGGTASPMSVYYNNRNRLFFIKKMKINFIAYLYSLITRKIIIFLKKDKWVKQALIDYKNGVTGRYDH